VGSGLIQVSRALRADVTGAVQAVPGVPSAYESLDASRGSVLVTGAGCGVLGDLYRTLIDPKCDYVHGNGTAQGSTFKVTDFTNGEWTGQSWYASQWAQGQSWYGQSWYGQSWYGQSWYGANGDEASEGEKTPLGTVLPGSVWYGVWH
jgi:hypothetical protein